MKSIMPTFIRKAWKEACKAQKNSHSPYSHYPVGACIITQKGFRLYSGCNVENSSYPAGICAERSAIVQAVSQGETKFFGMVVVTKNAAPSCALCLQVLSEFVTPDFRIFLASPKGVRVALRFDDLLPQPFTPQLLKRRSDNASFHLLKD